MLAWNERKAGIGIKPRSSTSPITHQHNAKSASVFKYRGRCSTGTASSSFPFFWEMTVSLHFKITEGGLGNNTSDPRSFILLYSEK